MESQRPESAGWKLDEISLDAASVYKVVGDEPDLASYNQKVIREIRGREDPWKKDWSAMYTQFLLDHTLGTVPYRWEQANAQGHPYDHANLVLVHFNQPIPVVVASGRAFWDGDVSGVEKASMVKDALRERGWDISSEDGLIEALGRQNKALLMQETEHEWELIFDRSHLAGLLGTPSITQRVVATFFKHQVMPVTSHWIAIADGSRRTCPMEGEPGCRGDLIAVGENDLDHGTRDFQ